MHVIETYALPAQDPHVGKRCHRCGKILRAADVVYLEPEAPASPGDAVAMAKGDSYTASAQPTHVKCNPRASRPID